MPRNQNIDKGREFDWGKTSPDYARFRDIYPDAFYEKIISLGLCTKGQAVLDIGTGTGVLPRHLSRFGASFTGVDISPQQIAEARRLSQGMDIRYTVSAAEEIDFPPNSFDVVTACQCFIYFDVPTLLPRIQTVLKDNGKFAIMYLAWLPEESTIARMSEQLVLRFNPDWTGAYMGRDAFGIPDWLEQYPFHVTGNVTFDLDIPFTRESWNGRMKACRGVGASLPAPEIERFEDMHVEMLRQNAPDSFTIPHYAHILVLSRK